MIVETALLIGAYLAWKKGQDPSGHAQTDAQDSTGSADSSSDSFDPNSIDLTPTNTALRPNSGAIVVQQQAMSDFTEYDDIIVPAAAKYGVSVAWVKAVIGD